jgi:putative ABC transport system permease protein
MQGRRRPLPQLRGEVASETEKSFIASFFSSFQGFIRVILIVGFLVVGAVVLIAANTSAMSVPRAHPEIAVLKSLGFRRRPILLALMASRRSSRASAASRAPPARTSPRRATRRGKTGAMPFLGPLASFQMSPAVATEGVVIALLVGLVAGAVPAWNGARLNVVEALRRLF